MTLPTDPNALWPPHGAMPADIHTWRAWYSGSPARLASDASPPSAGRSRFPFFWRRERERSLKAPKQAPPVHVPLAAEIAQTSADLLFGEMPDLVVSDPAQQRLDELAAETGLANVLLEAAEVCAAIGGVFLRVSWDTEVSDAPFLTTVAADHAAPEFRYGRLRAVTFWRELDAKGKGVWRHLERYEPGVILHGLYVGDKTHVGTRCGLEEHEATAALEPVVSLPEGVPPLLVWYVPNIRPLTDSLGSPYGRADVAGAEDLLDALDEAYSSWARDVRLAKTRILVPHDALETIRPERGSGRYFNADAEVFTELDGMSPGEMSIVVHQPAIRAEEHEQTVLRLMESAVSRAGYSPQTFGLRIEGRADSGTALRLREGKTLQTIERKRRYWAPAVKDACAALLAVDRAVLGHPTVVETPVLAWPEARETPQEQAQTLTLLRTAEAVSIETAVRRAQPDLDDEKLAAEVERIREDSGRAVSEPAF